MVFVVWLSLLLAMIVFRDGMQSTNRNVTRCILAIVVDADEKQWD